MEKVHGYNNGCKYEIVIGAPDNTFVDGRMVDTYTTMMKSWIRYAKEFFDKYGIYVSAIANFGQALYNLDWGCPDTGERVITFNCTPNPYFIGDLDLYEEGIMYITQKMKNEFKQNTITITKVPQCDVVYIKTEMGES